ncbi:MAG: phosphoribosyl-AMP cyclohydrolase [bacterium]
MQLVKAVKFNKDGLVPVIVQEEKTDKVLMLAYMNKQSLRKTLKDKKTCFWSRSRKKLWVKGETSGNLQIVKGVYVDCDGDTLLIKVRQLGKAVACHTGYKSCFYRKASGSTLKIVEKKEKKG